MSLRMIATAAALLFASPALAQDAAREPSGNWPQWRGPNADGVAPHADPPVKWGVGQNIRWKTQVPGRGSATPIIWNDRIFLLTAIKTDRKPEKSSADKGSSDKNPSEKGAAEKGPADKDAASKKKSPQPPRRRGRRGGFGRGGFGRGPAPTNYYQFVVLCLDRKTGKTRWKKVATEAVPHEGGHRTNTQASASPVTDGKLLYASFGSRGVFCYDFKGNLKWKRELGKMRTRASFGEGSSPALVGDTLVVNWDHEGQSFIIALDAITGKTRWKVDRDEQTTWVTPFIVEHKGRTQVIINGTKRTRSYDLADGKLIWECGGQASNPIANPIVKDGLVYCMTGRRGYAVYAISLDSKGNVTDTDKVAWHRKDSAPYVSSPILYGGLLYLTKSRNAVLSSLDPKSGKPVIDQKRMPDLDSLYASPVAAGGKIYYAGRGGTTLVIQPGPELKVLATNKLDDGFDASPALVGKQLFLRGKQHLYCIESQ